MFQHNLILTIRNFKRFKGTFFINLIGLSSGLACTLLIYLWVNDELRVDKFHEKGDRLFQVMMNYHNADGTETAPATPGPLAGALATQLPQVEYAVATTSGMEIPPFTLSVEDKNIKAAVQFAGPDFFRMFSYDLLQGDQNTVLQDKNSIVISQGLAGKLFNTTENILGKAVTFEHSKQYLISGIFKDIPPASSDQFDFVLSSELLKDINPGLKEWGNTGPRTFVLLREGTDAAGLGAHITGLVKANDKAVNATLFLRPYWDKYLYDKYENGKQAGGRIAYVKLFSVIALFIVIIACINFMNLSTAKASRRLKEVGIKKAIGARRETLLLQYLGESLLMALGSLIAAFILVGLLLPAFNQITGKQLTLLWDASLIGWALAIAVFTGLLAGSYPALYLSGFSPLAVLKGTLNHSTGEVWARKGLVVFQFTMSVILIVAVLVVYKQTEFVQSKNLGYAKDNVIYFGADGRVKESLETFLAEVKNLPGIVNASSTAHSFMGQQSWTSGLQWEGKNPDDEVQFEIAKVNHDLIQTLGIGMAAGRPFSRDFATDSSAIILNEAAVQVMGLKDPVGKVVKLWGQDRQVIGVAKNFHFQSLHEKVTPLFFLLTPGETPNVVVKIAAGKEKAAIDGLRTFYEGYNRGFAFDYKFLSRDYQALYAAESRVAVLSRYFAGLAILISCLGLFGLAAFTAERRRKEIGIRKVLGSSELGIVRLLSGEFTKMVLTSVVIALPISYLLTKGWLERFAYRIPLEPWYFLLAGLLALLVALATVGVQALKAARANPVHSLKDE